MTEQWTIAGWNGTIVNDSEGMTIAVFPGRTLSEAQANARIIAAAPAMLEALERIGRLTGAESPTEDELDGEDALHYAEHLGRYDAAVIARAAIAQARGIGQNLDVIA